MAKIGNPQCFLHMHKGCGYVITLAYRMDPMAKAAKLYAFSPGLIHEVLAKTSAITKGTSIVTASETRLLFMEMR